MNPEAMSAPEKGRKDAILQIAGDRALSDKDKITAIVTKLQELNGDTETLKALVGDEPARKLDIGGQKVLEQALEIFAAKQFDKGLSS